ncbi:hypothetical protein JCM10908_004476 [Rhodotorula pacifica]|uniref:uncharacterized protein n=1 Tax=Rhodotorula pacifica TaxID=1495444 RepID=UPI00316F9102
MEEQQLRQLNEQLQEWRVHGFPELNLLFYTKHPIIHTRDGQQVDISQAPVAEWTPAMDEAHEQINSLGGCMYYARLLDRVTQQLVDQTLGKRRTQSTNFRPDLARVTHFYVQAVERQAPHLPPSFVTQLPAIPYPVGPVRQAGSRYEGAYMQYLLARDGLPGANGQLIGTVPASAEVAGPRYAKVRSLITHRDGAVTSNGSIWPTQSGRVLMGAGGHADRHFGPHQAKPQGFFRSPFGDCKFELWPLGDPCKELRWKLPAVPALSPPTSVEWALTAAYLPSASETTSFASILRYDLYSPTADLARLLLHQARSALQPVARPPAAAHVHVLTTQGPPHHGHASLRNTLIPPAPNNHNAAAANPPLANFPALPPLAFPEAVQGPLPAPQHVGRQLDVNFLRGL